MDLVLFITFVVASITLIVTPGPNVLVVISTSISHGTKRGLQTVLGTSSAMVVQLSIAAFGTNWLVQSMSEGFEWLRWLGVAYLLYLGTTHLFSLIKENHNKKTQVTASGTFKRGFVVSLTNPKTILFFGAFLPQFASPSEGYMTQIILLSFTFLILATVLDSLYAIMAGRLRGFVQGRQARKVQSGLSGLLYVGAGAWLATLKRV